MSILEIDAPPAPSVVYAGLLARSGSGDRRAFAELYSLTSSRMLGLVMRVLRDRAQSEEVVQEVFLEVWLSSARFDRTKGNVWSLMLTMARRRAIDRVRASQASRARDLASGIRDLDVPHDSVTEAGDLAFERRRMTEGMTRLTRLQREAVTLRYLDGLSSKEVAARLGVSIATVKTRTRDGLIRLRAAMD